MHNSKTLLDKAQQQVASSKSTQTEAGQNNPLDKEAAIDAINQVFAEFELVYHNQFTKAFPSREKLQYGKKLWLSHLQHLRAEQIIAAAHRAIRESEYLPTIRGLLKYCTDELEMYGLPDARTAYVEACMAQAPQDKAQWSHPAVYFAGKASDWFFLANTPERQAFPVFERNYQLLCQRVRQGEQLNLPVAPALPESVATTPLTREEQQAQMQALRKSVNI